MNESYITIGEYKNISIPGDCPGEHRDRFILDCILKNCDAQVSEDEIRERAVGMLEQFDIRLSQQGLSIDGYYHQRNTGPSELMSEFMKHAERQIKERKILLRIAEFEGTLANEDDYMIYLQAMEKVYPLPKEKVQNILGTRKKDIMDEITFRKTIDYIIAHYCRIV